MSVHPSPERPATTDAPARPRRPVGTLDVRAAKGARRIAMLTAYDAPTAALVDACDIDIILVGDSLGMVMLGRDDTLSVTVDEMVHHCRAVTGSVSRALVVADMPFLSYETSPADALRSAGRLFREGGVRAVKLEGAGPYLPQIRALVDAGIPVMGHIGLTPQRVAQLGGFRVQGKTADAARRLLDDALALEQAGCFSMVLECVPSPVAARITAALTIPTIGIGAGPDCDGQVLVLHDMLGLQDRIAPRFVKRYANLAGQVTAAVTAYKEEVENGAFPGPEHGFAMSDEELRQLDADGDGQRKG
ncbi:3-methyl-2-oxobutanoate hydroxymethyltransferase [Nitratidesulfovibrio sp. D1]|uniref:3-methyl-2-oxobutanoate hydroxymethyltransferase n=1 Tax=Nitratidesulfovibrio sp. D1 TaxID=3440151 RepID=UPI003EBD037A